MNNGVGFLLRVTDVEKQPLPLDGLRERHHRERAVRAGAAVGVAVASAEETSLLALRSSTA